MATVWMRAKLAKMQRDHAARPRVAPVKVATPPLPTYEDAQVTLCKSGKHVPEVGKGKRSLVTRCYGNGTRRKMGLTPDVYASGSWLIPRTP